MHKRPGGLRYGFSLFFLVYLRCSWPHRLVFGMLKNQIYESKVSVSVASVFRHLHFTYGHVDIVGRRARTWLRRAAQPEFQWCAFPFHPSTLRNIFAHSPTGRIAGLPKIEFRKAQVSPTISESIVYVAYLSWIPSSYGWEANCDGQARCF